jgi:membrane protein YqaA with SNARE-associated domain
MKDSQFGFHCTREDLEPVRPLYTTMVIVQVVGALLGFLIGLLIQRRRDSAALQDNRVMVRRIGLIALLFSLPVFVFPFDTK